MAGRTVISHPVLTLRLETQPGFGTNVIRDAIASAINVATILNVMTITNMNGCDLICYPDEDVDAKQDALRHGWAHNAKVIS